MEHRAAAKTHVFNRIRERYGRTPELRDIDLMRLALLTNNENCFLRREYATTIKGVVRYQNIYVSAVYNKKIRGMVTVGIPLCGKHSESI